MNNKNLLTYASVLSVITTLCIIFVLLPSEEVQTSTLIALVLLSLSVGNFLYFPVSVSNFKSKQDASIFSSIGILSISSIVILFLTVIAFYLALINEEKISFAFDILSVGSYFLSMLITNWSAGLVDEISNNNTIQSNHKKWAQQIKGLSLLNESRNYKSLLNALYEKIEYSASDTKNGSEYDQEIDSKIEALQTVIAKSDSEDIHTVINQLDVLIKSRESYLRSIRSKA